MFIRRKADRRGRVRHQLVRSTRYGQIVRQHVLVDLGQAPAVANASREWRQQIVHLRQHAAELRSAAEQMRAKMPPAWLVALLPVTVTFVRLTVL